jgi:hypothetical protein
MHIFCNVTQSFCDADHSISLKFIEGHSTSHMKRAFQPQLYTRIFNCLVFISQRATVCISKGKEAS